MSGLVLMSLLCSHVEVLLSTELHLLIVLARLCYVWVLFVYKTSWLS
jgi:hypothetical protein